jgi:hypothetical protein
MVTSVTGNSKEHQAPQVAAPRKIPNKMRMMNKTKTSMREFTGSILSFREITHLPLLERPGLDSSISLFDFNSIKIRDVT